MKRRNHEATSRRRRAFYRRATPYAMSASFWPEVPNSLQIMKIDIAGSSEAAGSVVAQHRRRRSIIR